MEVPILHGAGRLTARNLRKIPTASAATTVAAPMLHGPADTLIFRAGGQPERTEGAGPGAIRSSQRAAKERPEGPARARRHRGGARPLLGGASRPAAEALVAALPLARARQLPLDPVQGALAAMAETEDRSGRWRRRSGPAGSWTTACRAANVPELLFHDLRRSAVRNFEKAGVSQAVAMQLSGHRTASIYPSVSNSGRARPRRRADPHARLHSASARQDKSDGATASPAWPRARKPHRSHM